MKDNPNKNRNKFENWNTDEFNEKIINPDLIAPEIGEVSGSPRDFDWEKQLKEYDPVNKDAQIWMGAGNRKLFQLFAKKVMKKKTTQFRSPMKKHSNLKFPASFEPKIFSVGQSHLDLGYRWRYLQSTEKIYVTGKKFVYHAKKIPEFSFTISQPVMLEWTLHKYPELFKEFQDMAAKDQLELAGGSYCEPDCHLPSGESWVRQRLYGQLFYKKYFNKYAETEWVQDSFGFTSTLPQFLLKSASKYIFTKKMYWNDTTVFPFSNFWWQSPDGSRILARSQSGYQRKSLLTNWNKFAPSNLLLKPDLLDDKNADIEISFNYESDSLDKFIEIGKHESFSQEMLPYQIFLYGQSDGGHGPRGIEVQTMLGLDRLNIAKLSTATDYFKLVEKDFGDRLPIWEDEIYLEYHRGTMTTSPLVKRMNRYNEWKLPALEKLCVITNLLTGSVYPQKALDESWKFTLLQQFHDVLPGSHPSELLDDVWAIWDTQNEKYSKIEDYLWNNLENEYNKSSYQFEIKENLKSIVKNNEELTSIILFNSSPAIKSLHVEIPKNELPISFENFDANEWVILTTDGEICDISILKSIDCGKRFYNLLERIAFTLPKGEPDSLIQVFLTKRNNLIYQNIENTADNINSQKLNEFTEISNRYIRLKFDNNTGSCISLKFNTNFNAKSENKDDNKWIETIQQGAKKFKSDLPESSPGILPQAFYEYSGVYAAWDLFPKSRKYPYPIKCKSISIDDPNKINGDKISVTAEFTLKTPSRAQISTNNKVSAKDNNADQNGRRDPDVIPGLPDTSEWEHTSEFSLTYTIFKDDPKVYLTIKSDFNAQETMVKLEIPSATKAKRIDLEIAYGIENRSTNPKTSRDKARWENIMHTWANLQSTDENWGLGIINNGKYGMDVHKGYIGITLVRGKMFPKPFFNKIRRSWLGYERKKRKAAGLGEPPKFTSQGGHIWNFVLYPHRDTYDKTNLLNQAHLFNTPIMHHVIPTNDEISDNCSKSIAEITTKLLPKSEYPIEISTVKEPHPDSEAVNWFGNEPNVSIQSNASKILIIRAVNWANHETTSDLCFDNLQVKEIAECDLLERKLETVLKITKNSAHEKIIRILTTWKPFEVKTFALLI